MSGTRTSRRGEPMPGWLKRSLIAIGRGVGAVAVLAVVLFILGVAHGIYSKVYFYAMIGTGPRVSVSGASSLGSRYAAVEIDDGDASSNVILEPGEWDALLALWKKAKAQQSKDWHVIGAITESDMFNPSRLTLSAGRGVRFAIVDDGICLRYDLVTANFGRFEAALERAKRHYTDDAADVGVRSGSADLRGAVESTGEAFKSSIPRTEPDCR